MAALLDFCLQAITQLTTKCPIERERVRMS